MTFMNNKLVLLSNDINNEVILLINEKTEYFCKSYTELSSAINKYLKDTYGIKNS